MEYVAATRNVRFTDAEWEALQVKAARDGMDASKALRRLARAYVAGTVTIDGRVVTPAPQPPAAHHHPG